MTTQNIQDCFAGMFGALVIKDGAGNQNDSTSFEDCLKATRETDKPSFQRQEPSNKAVPEKESQVFEANHKKQTQNLQKHFQTKETENIATQQTKEQSLTEEELADKAMLFLSQFLQNMTELLQVSQKELQAAMDELNLTEVDLLSEDNLQKLVLLLNQKTDSDLLTDENLMNQFNTLKDELQSLAEMFGISKDEMSEIISEPEWKEKLAKLMEDAANAQNRGALQGDTVQNTKEPAAEAPETSMNEDSFTVEVSDLRGQSNGQSENDTGETSTSVHKSEEKHSLQKKDTSVTESFLGQLTKQYTNGVDDISLKTGMASEIRTITEQILKQIKVVLSPETTTLEMQLNPEHLGKVRLSVTEENGQMTAKFVTENQAAKDAIESQMMLFKETLVAQGLKVNSVEVTVSEFAFGESDNKQQEASGDKGKKRNKFFEEAMQELTDIEDLNNYAEVFGMNGETIDYLA